MQDGIPGNAGHLRHVALGTGRRPVASHWLQRGQAGRELIRRLGLHEDARAVRWQALPPRGPACLPHQPGGRSQLVAWMLARYAQA
jgi:hypothetical protein